MKKEYDLEKVIDNLYYIAIGTFIIGLVWQYALEINGMLYISGIVIIMMFIVMQIDYVKKRRLKE